MASGSAAAVFVDRDGTLIRDVGYISRKDQLEILPGVPEALRRLRGIGLKIVMVTNQSGVARGMLTEADLKAIHEELCRRLFRSGAILDAIYYCPHHPQEGKNGYRAVCGCRKPKPGMVEQAAEDLTLDLRLSYVVGDQATDMELASGIQATGVWIRKRETVSDFPTINCHTAADFAEAALWIVQHFDNHRARVKG